MISIMCGTLRKSNSWKQAENEIITVIKSELCILQDHVIGKRDSLDDCDSPRRHRGYRMHALAAGNIITCLQNKGNSQNTKITKQGVSGMCLNFH